MATPDTTAVTQEDTELVDEHEDKPTAARDITMRLDEN